MNKPKLIIIRGQSGSGKSSIAEALKSQAKRPLVVIEQDYYHLGPLKPITERDTKHNLMCEMIKANVLAALKFSHDVLLEGVLTWPNYQHLFDALFFKHPDDNYMFYFDTSFEETVRRHKTRAKAQHFTEQEMQEWYRTTKPSNYPFEEHLSENLSLSEAIDYIGLKADLISSPSSYIKLPPHL